MQAPELRFLFRNLTPWPVHLIMTQCTDPGIEWAIRKEKGQWEYAFQSEDQGSLPGGGSTWPRSWRMGRIWTCRDKLTQQGTSYRGNCVNKHTGRKLWHVQENQNYFHLAAAQDEWRGMPEIKLERKTRAKLRRTVGDKPGGLDWVTRQ